MCYNNIATVHIVGLPSDCYVLCMKMQYFSFNFNGIGLTGYVVGYIACP